MTKSILTPQTLAALVAASPEGFFSQSELQRYADGQTSQIIEVAVGEGKVGHEGQFLYDPARLTADQVRERSASFSGMFPSLNNDGMPVTRPIADRFKAREGQLRRLHDPVLMRLVHAFDNTPGYLTVGELCTEPGDEGALMILMDMGLLKRADDLIFDPLRITRGSLREIREHEVINPVRQQLIDLLESKPGKTAPRVDLVEQFGANTLQSVLESGEFAVFGVALPVGESVWVCLKDSDPQLARQVAEQVWDRCPSGAPRPIHRPARRR